MQETPRVHELGLLIIIDTNTIGEIVELQGTGDGNCTKIDADDDNINMGEIQE